MMLMKATLVGLLAIPMTTNAALELDLSGLGKKSVEKKTSNTQIIIFTVLLVSSARG